MRLRGVGRDLIVEVFQDICQVSLSKIFGILRCLGAQLLQSLDVVDDPLLLFGKVGSSRRGPLQQKGLSTCIQSRDRPYLEASGSLLRRDAGIVIQLKTRARV